LLPQERAVRMRTIYSSDGAPTKQLLLIGDEPDTCLIVSFCLEEFEQWRIVTSNSESIEPLMDKAAWDAVLFDINPYDNSALKGFQLVKTHPSTTTVPVVMLTSWVMPQDFERLQQMPVAGIIAKPFDPLTLGQQVKQILHW
jgi:CheY-like chemotaxis protein